MWSNVRIMLLIWVPRAERAAVKLSLAALPRPYSRTEKALLESFLSLIYRRVIRSSHDPLALGFNHTEFRICRPCGAMARQPFCPELRLLSCSWPCKC